MKNEMKKDQMQHLLIIMLGGIGNAVLFLPALKALKEKLSNTHITLMTGESGVENIYHNESVVDNAILFDRRSQARILKTIMMIVKVRKRRFDLVLVASGTNSFKASLLTKLMGIPIRIGENIGEKGYWYTTKVPYEANTHETDGANKLVSALGIKPVDQYPRLSLKEEELLIADKFLRSNGFQGEELLIGMHAGCGAKQVLKRWPKERFAALGDKLINQYNARIVLTGSEQEVGLNGEIFRAMKNFPINAAGILTIRQTAALINRCRLFISNDSGVAHIAAAVETPLIVMFGNTEIERIAPRGEKIRIIKADIEPSELRSAMEQITVQQVLEAAKSFLV